MLKNATLEMIKKDLKKKKTKQLSQKQIISDRQRKGSRDIKNQNRFRCLSDSSDMEFENPTPRSSNSRSRSPIVPP